MQRGPQKEYIYALYFDDFPTEEHLSLGPVDAVFYVGRTNNLDRRLSEHRSSAKRGSEAKYVFIRELQEKRTDWDIKMLFEVEAGDRRPHERFAIIEALRQGANLKNMRQGDLHLDGLTMGELAKLASDPSLKTIDDLMAAETKIRSASRTASRRDPEKAVLHTQIKAMEAILRTAPKSFATTTTGDRTTQYTVYDMGEGQDPIWAERGMPLKDIARLMAPATREKLAKLAADFPSI